MRTKNKVISLLVGVFIYACSSQTPVDPSKPEMSVGEDTVHPPRTFNQFHHDWESN